MPTKIILSALIGLSISASAQQSDQGARLRSELPCILSSILETRGKAIRSELPLPQLILDTEADLKTYQDDVETQWNFRPDVIVNVFVASKNKIYLFTDPKYYNSKGRFIEDSLAHELHHYVQVFYDKTPVDQFSDFEETDAVAVQTAFRERFQEGLKQGRTICEMIKSESPKTVRAR